ncbi:MAG: sulfite dehydrogenase [Alphaproteobacteria bacterium]|nr:sulfite dehydrogenase [Alphaproteobacteria bacterium]
MGEDGKAPGRREVMRLGLAATGAVALGTQPAAADPRNLPPNVPPWSKGLGVGVGSAPYGRPSPHEDHVVRRTVSWLTATPHSSVSFTPLQALHGTVTPNGLVFERHHAGYPLIVPEDHRLMIHGLVERPLILTMAELARFPSVSRLHFIECTSNTGMEWRGAQMNAVQFTHGMLSCCEWTGVRLATLLAECGVRPQAKWLLLEGADAAGMTRSLPIGKALDDTIIAWAMNGERLRPENGYPVRAVVPGWEANLWVKWLRRIELGDQPWHSREETSKYTDLMPDGKARQFTFVMEAKSVITDPCPENPLSEHGFRMIGGIAWSGNGKIARVDVSVDGGRNWRPAELEQPILDRCLTRFRMPWRWTGEEAVLMSRAVDETGYVQPSIAELRRVRGLNSVYHNNAIQAWHVSPAGKVDNVQLG